MKLGQIEGVVRTEAGFIGGRDVTLVEYAPEQLALEELARRAKQSGVAMRFISMKAKRVGPFFLHSL